jgi:hypothetical protein
MKMGQDRPMVFRSGTVQNKRSPRRSEFFGLALANTKAARQTSSVARGLF